MTKTLKGLAGFVWLLSAFSVQGHAADDLLARGTYLMESIVACGNCHTPKTNGGVAIADMRLAGGFVVETPGFKAYAPNITQDVETGIGGWSDREIGRVIRDGLRPDGSIIGPPMPANLYRDISDRDLSAIIAYLRTVPAVKNVVPKSVYNIPLPPSWGPPVESVAEVSRDDAVAYGEYLAGPLGHCVECHTPIGPTGPDFTRIGVGGNEYNEVFGVGRVAISPNITPHPEDGLGAWSDDDIKTVIATGIRPDGAQLGPPMGFAYYKNIENRDLDAIVAYLRSLKPLPSSARD